MPNHGFPAIFPFGRGPARILVVSLFFAPACVHSRQKPPAPTAMLSVHDAFRNPATARFAISPDGKKVAFLQPVKARLNIHVLDTSAIEGGLDKAARLTEVTHRDITTFFWKGNNTIVYAHDENGDENTRLYAVDLKTIKTKSLTPFPGVQARVIDDLEESDEDHILIGLNKRNKEIFDAHRLNVRTGKITTAATNPGTFTTWLVDHAGVIRGAVASDGVQSVLYYRENAKDAFRKTLTTDFKNTVAPLFFTFDNRQVYAASNLGRDKSAIVVFDLATGKEKEKLFEHPDVDVGGLEFSIKRKVLTVALFTTWKAERHVFDASTSEIYGKIVPQLAGYEVAIHNSDLGESKFIIHAFSDKTRGTYYLYDKDNNKLSKLADVSPWLDEKKMASVKPISYKSRDGLTIHGYLTLPTSYREGQQIPIIVNPHGGPWARDAWGFSPERQWLASRGYGILQMNFRGSTGYGRAFWEASFGQWGKKMQDDITDGVNWLVAEKVADPKRVCIYGGSYGGYATLAGLAFTPDLYACGVDYVGVSNLLTFMKTIPPYWKPYRAMFKEMIGDPDKQTDALKAVSPVFHVARIKAPLFVAQGAKDPRVNIEESNQIVNALKARGIDVPYLVKENEGHGFRNEENRMEFYEKMGSFLDKHLWN